MDYNRLNIPTCTVWTNQVTTTGFEKLLPAYGAIPALPAQRDAFFAKKYADYPFVTQESWDVLLQGLAYPDIPYADQYQPNWKEAYQREQQFFVLLQSTPPSDLDFDTEWQKMIDDLNVIYSQLQGSELFYWSKTLKNLNSKYFGGLSGILISWNCRIMNKSMFIGFDWRTI